MTMLREPVVRSQTSHLRRFWLATMIVVASALTISGVVAAVSGARAGKIIFVSSVLVSAVVAAADGLVVIRRSREG